MPNNAPFRLRAGAGALAGILAVLIITGYSLYAALPYLLGPSLSVSETTEGGLTTISGTTARVSYLSINGMAVPLSEDGAFSAERAYPMGYTAVSVSARDRFGRTISKTITFLRT